MVVFTCDGCGETVKKNQVEKHSWKCRRSCTFSCIDCNVAFPDDSYKQHTKCISEDQKYSAKGTVFKENKGEAKQNAWFEQVQRAIELSDAKDTRLRGILDQLYNYPNVPRKESKFVNFLGNSLRIRDKHLAQQTWTAIVAAAAKAPPPPSNSAPTDEKNREEAECTAESSPSTNGFVNNEPTENDQFKWKTTLKRILKATPERKMKLKRLQRKAIEEYKSSHQNPPDSDIQLTNTIRDKLAKLKHVKLEGKCVSYDG